MTNTLELIPLLAGSGKRYINEDELAASDSDVFRNLAGLRLEVVDEFAVIITLETDLFSENNRKVRFLIVLGGLVDSVVRDVRTMTDAVKARYPALKFNPSIAWSQLFFPVDRRIIAALGFCGLASLQTEESVFFANTDYIDYTDPDALDATRSINHKYHGHTGHVFCLGV